MIRAGLREFTLWREGRLQSIEVTFVVFHAEICLYTIVFAKKALEYRHSKRTPLVHVVGNGFIGNAYVVNERVGDT